MSSTPSPLTPNMRWRGISAAIGCTAASALGLGGLLPLLSITMEQMAVPSWLIGLNAATPFLAAMLILPFVPRLMAHVPIVPFLILMAMISAATTLAYGLVLDLWLWFPLRFINGIALGVLFAISEAWINHFAEEHIRGRLIGFYTTILSSCFALGPVILWVAGIKGLAPYALSASLILLASLPVLLAYRLPEAFQRSSVQEAESHQSFVKFLLLAPTLSLAGIIFGAIEFGVITFIPIYSLRLGLPALLAATTLTAFSLGNIFCQIPIGMLADRYDRRKILFSCAGLASLAMLAILALFVSVEVITPIVLAIFAALLFLFGGVSVGIYTMAMVQIGQRFKGAELASANAALLFCYNLGSMMMPLAAGGLMDFAPRAGLPLILALTAASLFIPSLWQMRHPRLKAG